MRPTLLLLAVASLAACSSSVRTIEVSPGNTSDPAGMAAFAAADVVPGVEVLLADSLRLLQGKRVGLITNHTGRDRRGTSTIDLLHKAPGVRLVALFAPEHGLRGAARAGDKIPSSTDSATGLPIRSLYGETRVPTPAMLADVDVLVYDIQDVGARVYTYEWTMALAADAAGKLGKKFVVLDRPNPVRADIVEGGIMEERFRSFVGQYPVALRYGFTPGEMLRHLAGTGHVNADVTVIPMRGYRRDMWFEETGVPWVNPSPNLRTMDATILYTGTAFFEATPLSEGRGTDMPFQLIGGAWLTDAGAIARELNAMNLPGVRFDSTSRTVSAGQKWGGQTIPMIHVTLTDRNAVKPYAVGAHMLRAIWRRHPQELTWRATWLEQLTGSEKLRRAVEQGTVEALMREWEAEAAAWWRANERFRIYR